MSSHSDLGGGGKGNGGNGGGSGGNGGGGGSRPLALVTGASSGIGEAFARLLAADRHDLVLVARRGERLQALAEELSRTHRITVLILVADLSEPEELARVRREVAGGPALAMLVNAAGFGTRDTFVELDPTRTQAMIHLHVVTPVALARAALPAMLAARRGRIINVSSLGAFLTTARYVTYSATKAYVNMFTQGLAAELAGTGVTVQAVCPGLTRTGFFDSEELHGFRYQRVPQRFWMSSEEVARRALASRELIFIPGLHNRLLVEVLRTPLLGRAVGLGIEALAKRVDGLY